MGTRLHHSLSVRFILLVLLCVPLLVSGQGLGGGLGGESGRIEGKYKFMPLPYLNYDRSLDYTLGAIPVLMFNPSEKDTISGPSRKTTSRWAWMWLRGSVTGASISRSARPFRELHVLGDIPVQVLHFLPGVSIAKGFQGQEALVS